MISDYQEEIFNMINEAQNIRQHYSLNLVNYKKCNDK